MNYYIIEVRDSDGNDCTVFDALVSARTRDRALDKVWAYLEEMYPDACGRWYLRTVHRLLGVLARRSLGRTAEKNLTKYHSLIDLRG